MPRHRKEREVCVLKKILLPFNQTRIIFFLPYLEQIRSPFKNSQCIRINVLFGAVYRAVESSVLISLKIRKDDTLPLINEFLLQNLQCKRNVVSTGWCHLPYCRRYYGLIERKCQRHYFEKLSGKLASMSCDLTPLDYFLCGET